MTDESSSDQTDTLSDNDVPMSAAQGLEASETIQKAEPPRDFAGGVPSEYMQQLTRDRKDAARCVSGLAIFIIAVVNGLVLCKLFQKPSFEDPSKYQFLLYVVWKLGLVTVDIAATYFAVRLIKVAERLYLPLMLDHARMQALQGGKAKDVQLNQSDLIEVVRKISRV